MPVHRWILILILLITSFISGCTGVHEPGNPQPASVDHTVPAPTAAQDLLQTKRSWPELWLGLNAPGSALLQCASERKGQIWAGTPGQSFQPIFSNPEAGYYFPEWSPDGEQLAYIEIQPTEPDPPAAQTDRQRWVDQLKIISADRKNLHEIAFDFEDLETWQWMGSTRTCFRLAGIDLPPIWSPDGHWILIGTYALQEDGSAGRYTLYLVDVQSEAVQPLITTDESSLPLWGPHSDWIILPQSRHRELNLIHIQRQKAFEKITVAYPPEIPDPARLVYARQTYQQSLVGSFFSSAETGKPHTDSLWFFHLESQQWTKQPLDAPISWNTLAIGQRTAVFCGRDGLMTADLTSWKVTPLYSFSNSSGFSCGNLSIISEPQDHEFALISKVDSDPHQSGLWAAPLQSGEIPAEWITRLDALTLENGAPDLHSWSIRPYSQCNNTPWRQPQYSYRR